MRAIKAKSISFFTALKCSNGIVKVLFTSCLGGFSKGNYESLNLSPYVGDNEEIVRKNRKTVASFLSKKSDFVSVEQVHGKSIYRIVGIETGHLKDVHADAIICEFPDIAIGVLTADCVPLVLFSESGRIAVVHAGWKGLSTGIIKETVKEFSSGEDKKKIKGFIGPAIDACCYRVGIEVEGRFKETYPESVITRGGSIYLNLKQLAKTHLKEEGILPENIYISPDCTSCLSELYFSYRKHGEKTGRQAGLVVYTQE